MPRKGLATSLPAKEGSVVQEQPGGPLWDEDVERGLRRERHRRWAQLDTSFEPMELAAPS